MHTQYHQFIVSGLDELARRPLAATVVCAGVPEYLGSVACRLAFTVIPAAYDIAPRVFESGSATYHDSDLMQFLVQLLEDHGRIDHDELLLVVNRMLDSFCDEERDAPPRHIVMHVA